MILWGASAVITIVVLGIGWMVWLPHDKVAPGVRIADAELGGLTPSEAEHRLQSSSLQPSPRIIRARFEDTVVEIPTNLLGESPAYQEMVTQAMTVGRNGSWLSQLKDRWNTRLRGKMLPAMWRFDTASVHNQVASVSAVVNIPGNSPSVQLSQGVLVVNEGSRGMSVVSDELADLIAAEAGKIQDTEITVPVEVTVTPLSPDGIVAAQERAEKLKSLSFRLKADEADAPLTIPANQVLSWLTLPSGINEATISAQLEEVTRVWERAPISAEMQFSSNKSKLATFVPHRAGREVILDQLTESVIQHIKDREATTSAITTQPEIAVQFQEDTPDTTLGELNELGITERIAVGTSEYAGSIPNRVFNVGLTAQRLHGTVVMPGEEFSFNQTIGEISGSTGFKSAYVIMNGRTQLGDGGGVCQVSTTLFRAVLDGGLPVTRWKAHSYRVGYYEQNSKPGFDATVYAPSVDFRFKNDTAHAIAIAAYPDATRRFLTVEFWGTSDGRTGEVSNYRMWNQRSAPEPLFVDDPSLPAGKRQQIDWAAAGANASFHYVAKSKDGKIIQDREFVSIFRPWQAVYLVGTGGQ